MTINNTNLWSESSESSKNKLLQNDVENIYQSLWSLWEFEESTVKDMVEQKIYKALWLTSGHVSDAANDSNSPNEDAKELRRAVRAKVREIIDPYKKIESWESSETLVKETIKTAISFLKKQSYVKSNASNVQDEADVDWDNIDSTTKEWDDWEAESVDGKEQKPQTNTEKMAKMEKELKDAKNTLKDLAPDIVRVQLITNPTKIPKYLWRKIRNRKVNRKSRNPVDFVYALRMWGRKAFVPGSRKIENAYPLCRKLILEQKRIIRENAGEWWFKPEYLNAQIRLKQLELVAPQLKELSAKKQTKFATSAKDFGAGYDVNL